MGTNKTIVTVCEICEKPKTCKKCYGMLLCTSCICVVGMIKKRPEKILPIWERFGPADTPLNKSPAADAAAIAAPANREEECRIAVISSPFSVLLGRMAAIHNEDCLENFREARRLGITPLQGIMVRLTDKYIRACNWVRRNGDRAVKDEGLEDTLLGLANDSCLAILAHNEAEEKAEGEEDHNAKDVHQDQGPANSTGDLSELPEKMSAREEEEEEQVKD